MLWSVSVQDTFIFQVHQGLAVTQVASLSLGKKGLGWQKWLSELQGALSSHDYKVLFEFRFLPLLVSRITLLQVGPQVVQFQGGLKKQLFNRKKM